MSRMYASMEELERRTSAIEHAMPLFNLTSKWVVYGVVAVVGMVGAGLVRFIIVT
jgi:hypothetical protein